MLVNGEKVSPGWDTPQTWIYSTSDENVLTVDSEGFYTGVTEGTATVTATLKENPALTASMQITVAASSEDVRFIGTVPPSIPQYTTVGISAVHEVNGEYTNDPLEWEFNGADPKDYTVKIGEGSQYVEITCDSPSAVPLIVTARYNDLSESVSIKLLGY